MLFTYVPIYIGLKCIAYYVNYVQVLYSIIIMFSVFYVIYGTLMYKINGVN